MLPVLVPWVFIVDFYSEQKLRVRATVLPSVMTTNGRESTHYAAEIRQKALY